MTAKSHIGTCQWCGAEYDKRHIVEGKLRNYRPLYCCRECQRKAKKAKEKARNQKNAAKLRKSVDVTEHTCAWCGKKWYGGRPKKYCSENCRMLSYGDDSPEIPKPLRQCFFCPLIGWRCRMEQTPPCVPSSKLHSVYKQAVNKSSAILGEDRWL